MQRKCRFIIRGGDFSALPTAAPRICLGFGGCVAQSRELGVLLFFFSLTPTIIRGLVVWKRRILGEWAASSEFGDSQT